MAGSCREKAVFVLALVILLLPVVVLADAVGQAKTFFVESSYDVEGREEVSATLKIVSQNAYFYLENEWYQGLNGAAKEVIDEKLEELSQEFDETIYPELTAAFGQEWSPGIDNDSHVTVLFHQMKDGVAGYFRSEDEYPNVQSSTSNQREMVYLSAPYLQAPMIKSYNYKYQ